VTALAPDVYFVRAAYNSVFVVFNEYVLVLEAPRNDALTPATIANIKKTAPGKPIRYVVPTHWHYDHLGGIRGYIAEAWAEGHHWRSDNANACRRRHSSMSRHRRFASDTRNLTTPCT
jgi:glyoxylase-like metal-dependent hydrolase (beta-lactamase superfamily II)